MSNLLRFLLHKHSFPWEEIELLEGLGLVDVGEDPPWEVGNDLVRF